MRNLKRVLALALALVMMLGMMITASAATYTDDAAIDADYAEAVEVLTGMGLFKGQSTTAKVFAPKAILTRAEAAALIYRAITGDVADKQVDLYDYTSFADVQEGAWYTPYITYAANGGYLKGYAGNAMPNDTVTGIQVIAIMLRAAGYGQNGEYEGAAWKDNILTDAQELGITKGLATNDLDKAATRELVAQLIFNAMTKAYLVTYTPALGYLPVNAVSGDFYVTLAEKVFDLASTTTEDAWGRPATVWFKNTDRETETTPVWDKLAKGKYAEPVYATIAEEALAVHTVATSQCEIAQDFGMSKKFELYTYTNGVLATETKSGETVAKMLTINPTSVRKDLGGQGTLIEVYEDRLVIIDTYLAKVTNVIEEKTDAAGHITRDAYVKLTAYTGKTTTESIYVKGNDYAVGDYVLVYINEDTANNVEIVAGGSQTMSVKYVEVYTADTMVGAQTAYTTKASHIVEGTEYADAAKFYLDQAGNETTKHTWFLDLYGNLIGVVDIQDVYSYGTITAIKWVDQNNTLDSGYALAEITYMDGNSDTVTVESIKFRGADTYTTLTSGGFFSYYYLGRVAETVDYNYDEFTNVALYQIEEGKDGLKLTETTYLPNATTETGVPALTDEIDAGNATMFLVWDADDEEYETYTGIKNVPTYDSGEFWYVDLNNDNIAEYVYIIDPTSPDDEQTITYYYNRDLTVTTNLKKTGGIASYTISGGYVDGEPKDIVTTNVGIVNAIKNNYKSVLLILTETNGKITAVEPVTTTAVKVDSLGAYVVYAGDAYSAYLSEAQDVLVDEYGFSYDVEGAAQIADDEDLANAIEDDSYGAYTDAAEYLYVVYKTGTRNTKIASLVYVSSVENEFEAPETVTYTVSVNGVDVWTVADGETIIIPEGANGTGASVNGEYYAYGAEYVVEEDTAILTDYVAWTLNNDAPVAVPYANDSVKLAKHLTLDGNYVAYTKGDASGYKAVSASIMANGDASFEDGFVKVTITDNAAAGLADDNAEYAKINSTYVLTNTSENAVKVTVGAATPAVVDAGASCEIAVAEADIEIVVADPFAVPQS